MIVLVLALAGGLGAAARFLVDSAIERHSRLSVPVGTLVVNVTACLAIGLLTGWLGAAADAGPLATVLGVGFLGGYSTFSTASVEAARLLLDGRGRAAAAHAAGMLLVCLAAGWLGLTLAT